MKVEQVGRASVVRLAERVDSFNCQEVESTLQALTATNPRQVICDCTATNYMSSAGLRVILAAARNLKQGGGQLALVCTKRQYVYEVLGLSGIMHIIPVFETVDETLGQLV